LFGASSRAARVGGGGAAAGALHPGRQPLPAVGDRARAVGRQARHRVHRLDRKAPGVRRRGHTGRIADRQAPAVPGARVPGNGVPALAARPHLRLAAARSMTGMSFPIGEWLPQSSAVNLLAGLFLLSALAAVIQRRVAGAILGYAWNSRALAA